jgi:hypothetical protein
MLAANLILSIFSSAIDFFLPCFNRSCYVYLLNLLFIWFKFDKFIGSFLTIFASRDTDLYLSNIIFSCPYLLYKYGFSIRLSKFGLRD